jgi:hypothetical protein
MVAALYLVYALSGALSQPLLVASYPTMTDCEEAAKQAKAIGSGRSTFASDTPAVSFICIPVPEDK